MNKFDEQLLRLKQAVKLTADKDVAELLGMTKAAFSDRKKRGVFPDDKLFTLATLRPDLRLDVLGILVGQEKDAVIELTLAELKTALALGAERGGSISEQMARAGALVEAMHTPPTTDEQMWLDCYREWPTAVKKRELARALAVQANDADKPANSVGGTHTSSGAGAVHMGQVSGVGVRTGKSKK